MSKSLHFCTPEKLSEVKTQTDFSTIRTGFLGDFEPGEVIRVNERDTAGDTFLCHAEVKEVRLLFYYELESVSAYYEEVARYHRPFKPHQPFLLIRLHKVD